VSKALNFVVSTAKTVRIWRNLLEKGYEVHANSADRHRHFKNIDTQGQVDAAITATSLILFIVSHH